MGGAFDLVFRRSRKWRVALRTAFGVAGGLFGVLWSLAEPCGALEGLGKVVSGTLDLTFSRSQKR